MPQPNTVSYVALADFEGDSTNFGEDLISIHKDEVVEVVEQHNSGIQTDILVILCCHQTRIFARHVTFEN